MLSVPLRETPGQVIEYGALPPMHVRFEAERLTNNTGCVGIIRFNIFMTPVMPQFEDAMSSMGRAAASYSTCAATWAASAR